MPLKKETLEKEIQTRIKNVRNAMEKKKFEALIVYGDNKIFGSLRYLTNYFPDRAGWISLGSKHTYLFEGASLILPLEGDPVLLLDPGLIPTIDTTTRRVLAGSLSTRKGCGLSAESVVRILKKSKIDSKANVGIETWDRFPAPLYIRIAKMFSRVKFTKSTVVEEQRMIKSPLEITLFREAGAVGDKAHSILIQNLVNGIGKTELEIIRATEHSMRTADPIYEDGCSCSPSLICSGLRNCEDASAMLHLPYNFKKIRRGDIVHWDICMRYCGYPIDTARTKVIGDSNKLQRHTFDAALDMHNRVLRSIRPGMKACDLVGIAEEAAKEMGYDLWMRFLGHGLGLDIHERPDMGMEETKLAAGMVLAIEPRIAPNRKYIVGFEDMLLVTESGFESLTKYEKTFEIASKN